MPRKQFKTMAKRHKGVSAADLERYWKDAEKAHNKLPAKSRKSIKDKDAYLMGTVLQRIKTGTGKKYQKQSEGLGCDVAFRVASAFLTEANLEGVVAALETTLATAVTTGAPAGTRDDDEEEACAETDSTTARLGPSTIHRDPRRFGYPK